MAGASWLVDGGAELRVAIRAATEEDIEHILEIERECISPPWTHGSLLSEVYNEDSFFALALAEPVRAADLVMQADTTIALVQSPDGAAAQYGANTKNANNDTNHIVGFVILRRAADECELLQIAVDKASRRCGIAETLMEAALRWARDAGAATVFLEVRKSNNAAIMLYEKHGFKKYGARKNYYADPIEDAVVMKLSL